MVLQMQNNLELKTPVVHYLSVDNEGDVDIAGTLDLNTVNDASSTSPILVVDGTRVESN